LQAGPQIQSGLTEGGGESDERFLDRRRWILRSTC